MRDVPNLVFESLREAQATRYHRDYHFRLQEILEYIRGSSTDRRIPLTYVDTNRKRKIYEARGRWRYALMPPSLPSIFCATPAWLAGFSSGCRRNCSLRTSTVTCWITTSPTW